MLRGLIVACALAFVAQATLAQVGALSPDHPAKPKKPPGNCTVSGRVVSAAEGSPLRSARVGLIQANERRHPLVYATTTDNDGRFEIKQIEAGRYEFFASHTGYLEQQYQSKGGADDEGAVLSLVSGQALDNALFRLVRAGVITGKVVDDAGEPLVNANVSVFQKPTDEEREDEGPRSRKVAMTAVSAGSTDDRGEYRIYGLKPGEYYLKAAETGEPTFSIGSMNEGSYREVLQELGSQFAPLYYPGVLQTDQAQAITLSAGEEAQADFAMRRVKLVEVSGRVIGADGSPATGAYATLSVPNVNDWGGELGSSVDSKGEFSIKGVPPGSYILSVLQSEQGKHYSAQQRIEVGEKIDSIVIAVGRGAKVHGRIIAVGGGTVMLERVRVVLGSMSEDEAAGTGFAEVKKDGTFEIDGIADGGYALNAFGMEPGWFVKSAQLGSEDVLQKGVQVENGAVPGSLDIVISNDGAQIEGTVTDSDKNQPLAGVLVKARVNPPSDYNQQHSGATTTDQNGHYVLKDLPPGKYKISAKIASSGAGVPPVKSEPVALSVGAREHRALDIKLIVPKSE